MAIVFLSLNIPTSENVFLVVYHRNHFGVMSSLPLDYTVGVVTYNFSDNSDKAYGGNNGHKQLSPGIWGLMSGNGLNDKQIDNKDKDDLWLTQSGSVGYFLTDFNMDGQVNELDIEEKWHPNAGKSSQVPE